MALGSDNKTAGRSTQFKKGQSGNPKGRPRKAGFELASSSYGVIFDRTLAVTTDGVTKELGVEEALQLRTYNQALEGNRRAQRRILKMIAQREKALAQRTSRYLPIERVTEHGDPDNAFDALLVLGLAKLDPSWDVGGRRGEDYSRRLLLEPWAVQLAFRRRRRRRFSNEDLEDIRRLTRDPDTLDWPTGDPDA